MTEKWRVVPKITLKGIQYIIQTDNDGKWCANLTSETFSTAELAIKKGLELLGTLAKFENWMPEN